MVLVDRRIKSDQDEYHDIRKISAFESLQLNKTFILIN
jgi:hypothetical protein